MLEKVSVEFSAIRVVHENISVEYCLFKRRDSGFDVAGRKADMSRACCLTRSRSRHSAAANSQQCIAVRPSIVTA